MTSLKTIEDQALGFIYDLLLLLFENCIILLVGHVTQISNFLSLSQITTGNEGLSLRTFAVSPDPFTPLIHTL